MQKNKRQIKTMGRESVARRRENGSTKKNRDSSCECYCKLKKTNDESSPLSSQRFIEKSTGSKSEKMTASTTIIDLHIESPNKQQFKTNDLERPTLSPDTQKAIENAEKILEEVRYKITEATKISTTGFNRGIKKELYTGDLEPPLEDETEENLYIRELVTSRLNKVNGLINEESDVSTDRKNILNSKVIKKRGIDLLAPKFRTMERRFKDILYPPINHGSASFEKIKSGNSKSTVSNETKNDDFPVDTKILKTKSLTIQNGPPLNIDRELKKQNVGFVHISPDASYVESNTNINFYSFSHESCKKKKYTPLKSIENEGVEKLMDNAMTDIIIDKLDRSANENQFLTEKTNISEGKSFGENNVAVLTDVLGKGDDILFEDTINNGRGKKDRGNVSEHLPRTGVDYSTLNDEPNSYYLNDARKNEEIVHYEGKGITQKICSNDVGTDVQNLLSKDERNDTIQLFNDDKDSNCYEKRTNDDVTKIEDDIEKCRKKKMIDRVNSTKNITTTHERNSTKEFPSSKVSNKRNKFKEGKESTHLSDTSLQDTDASFNDIELNAPSIETFDNILLVYDKVIDRVSKSEKKIEDTLRRLELSLSNESLKPVVTNTTGKSYDLIPFKKADNFHNIDKSDPILLLSNKSKSTSIERKEDKLEINSSMSNYVLKKDDSCFFKKKYDLKNKHLQSFSNGPPQNIPNILKNFIMDIMNRESGLVFDFLSIQKQDDDTTYTDRVQNGSSLQAIAQGDECKIQKDVIIDSQILQEPSLVYSSDRITAIKEKSLKVSPINLIEIKPTTNLIDELSQTETEILEKGTQYEISYKQNHTYYGDDKIIKNVRSDKNSAENVLEKNNEMDDCSTREMEKNDDSEKNNKNSTENITNVDPVKNAIMKDLHSDPNFSEKIHKLSDSEDSSSRTNIKRIYTNVSRFTTTSSETSHSEGELYLPSSCSYSLGEVRMGKNSTSMCNHALVSTSTPSCLGETTSLLRHSSGEIYIDSSNTL